MITVIFSRTQQRFSDGHVQAEFEAKRVDDLIRQIYARYPNFADQLEHAAVAVDGVMYNDALYVPLPAGAEVHFVGAVAGGAGNATSEPTSPLSVADPLGSAQRWVSQGIGVALATVIETWGSSPCPPGSLLAVNAQGHFEGSVSGGCVEGAVIEKASEVLMSGAPVVLEFGVADEDAWAVGLACGGRVRIFVERVE